MNHRTLDGSMATEDGIPLTDISMTYSCGWVETTRLSFTRKVESEATSGIHNHRLPMYSIQTANGFLT